jgi:phenylpropionate dioxygenase-like ring-hydroxylating dioxygenase large terminal subunit
MMQNAPKSAFDIATTPEQSWTLPGRAYTDPAIFEQERTAIHFRTWHYAGSTQELKKPGSYITARILNQTVIIVRGKDDVIRGFFNVCQHRAHELLIGRGNVSLITCPYHAWSYTIDGRFRAGAGTADMPQTKSGAFNLKTVRVETFADQFVFFNLDPHAMPLAEQAVGVAAELRKEVPQFDQLVIDGPPVSTEIQANWKVVVDNYLECYHCRTAHPALADLLDMKTYHVATHEYWMSQKSEVLRDENAAYRVSPDAASRTGRFWWLWPMTTFNALPGSPEVVVFNFLPLEPGKTLQTVQRFALPGAGDDKGRERYQNGPLTLEDVHLCESVQRGLNSLGYSAGRFVNDATGGEISEAAVHQFHRLVARALASA